MATSCVKPGNCGTKAPVWLRIPEVVSDIHHNNDPRT